MRKFIVATMLVAAFLLGGPALDHSRATDGRSIFEGLLCGGCHKPDKKGKGRNLQDISRAHKTRESLVQFFDGEGKPLLESPLPLLMQNQMESLKSLSADDKNALADYILTFK